MGHCIGYLDFQKSKTTPRKILKKIGEFAYDPRESGRYHGNLKFHETPVYKNRDEAYAAIERMDRGWYDDHAVVYKEGRTKWWLVKYEYHC